MKSLKKILDKVRVEKIIGSLNITIKDISFNTKKTSENSLFVAIKGNNVDSHDYIQKAILLGSCAILCETFPKKISPDITYIQVKNSRIALAICSANFFNNPSRKIKLVGVTGTNGKTSVATFLFNLFDSLNIKSGLISTIQNKINNKAWESKLTTPDPYEINFLLNEMVNANCEFCFMEVSSHGISQGRIEGLNFICGVFTNLSRDHLDYHADYNDYVLTKKKFFDHLGKNSIAIINTDDCHSSTMLKNNLSTQKFYSLNEDEDYYAEIINNELDGLELLIDGVKIKTKIPGIFNAYNLLAIYAVAHELGQDKIQILSAIKNLNPVSGRLNIIQIKGIIGVIDYAHSPAALEKVFESIHPLKKSGKIITLIGCGGNRDVGKRPIMGKIAYQNSDISIFTSDNPRHEDIANIISAMASEIKQKDHKKLIFIHDRREAILKASDLAERGDIILILGKGHEAYQDIQGVKKPFNDYQILTKNLT